MNTHPQTPTRHPLLKLISAIVLAAIPSALVMADRWFHLLYKNLGRDVWCGLPSSIGTCLPPYFLTVNLCMLGLLAWMFFLSRNAIQVESDRPIPELSPGGQAQTRLGQSLMLGATAGFALIVLISLIKQQYPGWSLVFAWLVFLIGSLLKTCPAESMVDALKNQGELWISLLFTHLAQIALLAGYFNQSTLIWAPALLLLLALINLWRFRQRLPLIFWIISLALIVYSINLNGWWTAFIGDDDIFYDFAAPLTQTNLADLGTILFKADGVYGTHPYFSSLLQALSMKILGTGNFGWRFSSLYLCALGVGLFYLFCKNFLSQKLSLLAAFLLAVSAYIMSFGKIGYNNLQAFFALTLVLALAGWALRSGLQLAFVLLGSSLALCFYTYPAALYILPLPFLLLGIYAPPLSRAALKRWIVMLSIMVALIFPLLLQPVYWQSKLAGTVFNRTDLLQSVTALFNHFANNVLYAFYSFLYLPRETHFVVVSYLDPLTAIFFLLGFCALVFQLRRQRLAGFILIAFILFLLTVGASHDRETPPTTRMFLFLPLYALIAVWGLKWTSEQIRQTFPIPKSIQHGLIAFLLVATTGLNLYQAYPLSHARSRYFTSQQMVYALFVRISQQLEQAEPNIPKSYLFIANAPWDEVGLETFPALYPSLAGAQIQSLILSGVDLSPADLALITDRDAIIILTPWLDPHQVTALAIQLKTAGKESCALSTPARQESLTVYHSPDLSQACQP